MPKPTYVFHIQEFLAIFNSFLLIYLKRVNFFSIYFEFYIHVSNTARVALVQSFEPSSNDKITGFQAVESSQMLYAFS